MSIIEIGLRAAMRRLSCPLRPGSEAMPIERRTSKAELPAYSISTMGFVFNTALCISFAPLKSPSL